MDSLIHWASLADFAAMGGYALYVWGSFAMTAAAVVWEGLTLAQRRRDALDELRADISRPHR
jgi:heme exporter protein D